MVEEYIHSKVNEETGTLLRSQKESIAKRWLDNMRGLFDRRVIVFVHNLGSSHWTATWVVNPGHIQFLSDDREMMLVDVNSKTNDSKPRTMFLYYDSMGPTFIQPHAWLSGGAALPQFCLHIPLGV